jgi:hypothetical protein
MWNTITGGDFRHTGRTDYIVGNLGQNSLLQASDQYPIYITAKNFDGSGFTAPSHQFFFPMLPARRRNFRLHGREDQLKQMISLKKKYTNYKSFATATLQDMLTPEQLNGALRLKANYVKIMLPA